MSDNCNGDACCCETCGRFISEGNFTSFGFGLCFQTYCIRTKSQVNPRRHRDCAFHSNRVPLTEAEQQKVDKIKQDIEDGKKRVAKLREQRLARKSGSHPALLQTAIMAASGMI